MCMWAAISPKFAPTESAICGQRRGKAFGQLPAASQQWLPIACCRVQSLANGQREEVQEERCGAQKIHPPVNQLNVTLFALWSAGCRNSNSPETCLSLALFQFLISIF